MSISSSQGEKGVDTTSSMNVSENPPIKSTKNQRNSRVIVSIRIKIALSVSILANVCLYSLAMSLPMATVISTTHSSIMGTDIGTGKSDSDKGTDTSVLYDLSLFKSIGDLVDNGAPILSILILICAYILPLIQNIHLFWIVWRGSLKTIWPFSFLSGHAILNGFDFFTRSVLLNVYALILVAPALAQYIGISENAPFTSFQLASMDMHVNVHFHAGIVCMALAFILTGCVTIGVKWVYLPGHWWIFKYI